MEDWQMYRGYAVLIGALNPLPYLFVLIALTFTPVSYIAPSREVSILVGALFGTHLLKEGNQRRRIIAASVMLLGFLFLATG